MVEQRVAVVDTNVWFDAALVMGYFVSVITWQTQREMWAVAGRNQRLREMISVVIALSEDVSNRPPRVKTYLPPVNSGDVKIVNAALQGDAFQIVTYDGDFRLPKVVPRLKRLGISVVTPAEFLTQIDVESGHTHI